MEETKTAEITAEEFIIKNVGDFWWICGKHKPEFLKAIKEYTDQQLTKQQSVHAELKQELEDLKEQNHETRIAHGTTIEDNIELKKQISDLKTEYNLAISGFRIKEIHLKNIEKQNEELVNKINQLNGIWSDRFPDCICNKYEKRYCPSHSDGPDC